MTVLVENTFASEIKTENMAEDVTLKTVTAVHGGTSKELLKKVFYFNTSFRITKTEDATGSKTNKEPVIVSGIDEILVKCDCFDGNNVGGTKQSVLYCFTLDELPAHKMN